jgi:hypothetical protein
LLIGYNHKISIPAYAIEQQYWQSGVPKNEMSLMSLIIKNDARSLAGRVAIFQEFVNTPVKGRPSLFGIDSVHQVETSLSHALLVY